MEFNHIDKTGKVKMVDVSGKGITKRTAVAKGRITLKPETIRLLKKGLLEKGEALACARVAGIAGAKKTSEVIPLCHNILLDNVRVDFKIVKPGVEISASVVSTGKTGAEMEALTAVTIAALTIYDMCKAVDKEMVVTGVRLVEKRKESALI